MDRAPGTAPRTPTRPGLPSRAALAVAVAAIVLAGTCGGLIGWAVTDVQCRAGRDVDTTSASAVEDASCPGLALAGGGLGVVVGGGGVGVLAVLVLRAMGEWRRQEAAAIAAGADPAAARRAVREARGGRPPRRGGAARRPPPGAGRSGGAPPDRAG